MYDLNFWCYTHCYWNGIQFWKARYEKVLFVRNIWWKDLMQTSVKSKRQWIVSSICQHYYGTKINKMIFDTIGIFLWHLYFDISLLISILISCASITKVSSMNTNKKYLERTKVFPHRTFSKGFFLLTFNRELVKDIFQHFLLCHAGNLIPWLWVCLKREIFILFRTSAFV